MKTVIKANNKKIKLVENKNNAAKAKLIFVLKGDKRFLAYLPSKVAMFCIPLPFSVPHYVSGTYENGCIRRYEYINDNVGRKREFQRFRPVILPVGYESTKQIITK